MGEQIERQRKLLLPKHRVEGLLDVFADHLFRFAFNDDRFRQPAGGESQNVLVESGAEEQRLTFSFARQLGDDPLDVRDESHVEHSVGFVDHQHFDLREVEAAAARIIDDPPGGSDDDVDRPIE